MTDDSQRARGVRGAMSEVASPARRLSRIFAAVIVVELALAAWGLVDVFRRTSGAHPARGVGGVLLVMAICMVAFMVETTRGPEGRIGERPLNAGLMSIGISACLLAWFGMERLLRLVD